MILIFDLDDTLYPERQFVESGFRAVAQFGLDKLGWDADWSFAFMMTQLEQSGRGAIFNRWLASRGMDSRRLVADCIRVYRHHKPNIALDTRAEAVLDRFRDWPLYLVTDGHKIVQANKVRALGIVGRFRKIYITHRYGIAHAKPSTLCFERIRARERCDWSDMMYVGDNPAKDFVGLKPLGVHTVRILGGEHKDRKAAEHEEAEYRIRDIGQLVDIVEQLTARRNTATKRARTEDK